MEEKRFPVQNEEANVGKVSEPVLEYAATGSGIMGTAEMECDDNSMMSDDYDPGIGPYSMEELNARIDEAEAAIERTKQGDWSDWVTSEEMTANLYERFPWL